MVSLPNAVSDLPRFFCNQNLNLAMLPTLTRSSRPGGQRADRYGASTRNHDQLEEDPSHAGILAVVPNGVPQMHRFLYSFENPHVQLLLLAYSTGGAQDIQRDRRSIPLTLNPPIYLAHVLGHSFLGDALCFWYVLGTL